MRMRRHELYVAFVEGNHPSILAQDVVSHIVAWLVFVPRLMCNVPSPFIGRKSK